MSYIEFKDFNFKLVVIQQLMYERELITPKFDAYDFAASYKERAIEIDEEGYEIIPEIKDYFEKLEVDEKYAAEITEIYQDGAAQNSINSVKSFLTFSIVVNYS